MVFAGPCLKADDLLARDVAFFQRDVLVITADRELISRCKNAFYADRVVRDRGGGNGGGGSRRRSNGYSSSSSRHNNRNNKESTLPDIKFLHPLTFINDMEAVVNNNINTNEHSLQLPIITRSAEGGDKNGEGNKITDELLGNIDEEIQIRANMYSCEMLMREKKNMSTPKKRRKLQKRARMLCEKLALRGNKNGGQTIDSFTSVKPMTEHEKEFQEEVLCQWEKLRRTATRREMTGDRMMLAEHFRRQVERMTEEEDNCGIKREEEIVSAVCNNDAGTDSSSYDKTLIMKKDAIDYVRYVNSLQQSNSITSLSHFGASYSSSVNIPFSTENGESSGNRPLRLVVISDTHGFEEELTPNNIKLPYGDILLHLGDFAIDTSLKKKYKAIEKFDSWLAKQPHRVKIVLRGNHDPFKVNFPQSKARYVSRPQSVAVGGKLTIFLIPWCSSSILTSSWRKLPMFCDVLASHSPPYNVLDTCYNGNKAGCATLRGKVERMTGGCSPMLWLCGHIHEGRGSSLVKFGAMQQRETLVVNAANANVGKAEFLEHDAVVLDVGLDDKMVVLVDEQEVGEEKEDKKRRERVLVP